MARKRKKNIIKVAETRQFLFKAYGLKSREVTDYEIEIFHEEAMMIFEWYHTSRKLIVRMKTNQGVEYGDLGKAADGETVAIRIVKYVYDLINRRPELRRDPTARTQHKNDLKKLRQKIGI